MEAASPQHCCSPKSEATEEEVEGTTGEEVIRNLRRLRTEGGEREGKKEGDEKRRVREVGTGLKTSGPIEFFYRKTRE